LKQQKFRIQILLARRMVDDGNGDLRKVGAGMTAMAAMAAAKRPFGAEHLEKRLLRGCGRHFGQQRRHFDAASFLRARQHRVEQAAAGVGVDFDQSRAGVIKMKVITEKYAARGGRMLRDCRRMRQHMRLISRQRDNALDRRHQRRHAFDLRGIDEQGRFGEQMRPLGQQ
jgi:hypothetical protein